MVDQPPRPDQQARPWLHPAAADLRRTRTDATRRADRQYRRSRSQV